MDVSRAQAGLCPEEEDKADRWSGAVSIGGDTLSGLGAMLGRGRIRGWADLVPPTFFTFFISFFIFFYLNSDFFCIFCKFDSIQVKQIPELF
jgi:hypothetical protein